jgi:hypothetical protein
VFDLPEENKNINIKDCEKIRELADEYLHAKLAELSEEIEEIEKTEEISEEDASPAVTQKSHLAEGAILEEEINFIDMHIAECKDCAGFIEEESKYLAEIKLADYVPEISVSQSVMEKIIAEKLTVGEPPRSIFGRRRFLPVGFMSAAAALIIMLAVARGGIVDIFRQPHSDAAGSGAGEPGISDMSMLFEADGSINNSGGPAGEASDSEFAPRSLDLGVSAEWTGTGDQEVREEEQHDGGRGGADQEPAGTETEGSGITRPPRFLDDDNPAHFDAGPAAGGGENQDGDRDADIDGGGAHSEGTPVMWPNNGGGTGVAGAGGAAPPGERAISPNDLLTYNSDLAIDGIYEIIYVAVAGIENEIFENVEIIRNDKEDRFVIIKKSQLYILLDNLERNYIPADHIISGLPSVNNIQNAEEFIGIIYLK